MYNLLVYMRSMCVVPSSKCPILSAIAGAVKHWQEVKVQGELEETNNEEEDIYADARLVEVMDTKGSLHLVPSE